MTMKNEDAYLTLDIGGSNIKAIILNANGDILYPYSKIETPENANPTNTLEAIEKLIKNFPVFNKISVGFPGYVKNGVVFTAPNLDNEAWKNFNLANALTEKFKKPTKVVNDADLQGLAIISNEGLEMVITLGTGFGTALFLDGKLLPHLELAHLPVRKNKDYDDFIGDKALEEEGVEKWNLKLKEVLKTFKTVINYDKLYLSGGNSKKINFKLDDNVTVVGNRDGIKGGAFLWADS